jgi:hypothetical protein
MVGITALSLLATRVTAAAPDHDNIWQRAPDHDNIWQRALDLDNIMPMRRHMMNTEVGTWTEFDTLILICSAILVMAMCLCPARRP